MNSKLVKTVADRHVRHFGVQPTVIAYAPGRVEILGNHTDYNEGLVLSAAINMGVCMAVSPRPDLTGVVRALDIEEKAEFRLPVLEPRRERSWADYILGVVHGIGLLHAWPHGFQATFSGDLPLGAGLSSSAALEVSAALALAGCYNLKIAPLATARLCQAAENKFAGAHCGLLDQISSLFGARNALVASDFRTLAAKTVPLNENFAFLLANTGVKHNLAESEYNSRRAQCEKAVAYFASALPHAVRALRDVSLAELEQCSAGLDPVSARRAAHVIGENTRVEQACRYLQAGDAEMFGELMFQSHQSSRINFENSCPELDLLVDEAQKIKAILGARLSGGGFGGSIVALINPRDAVQAGQILSQAYETKYRRPCATMVVQPSAGAHII